MCRQDSLFAPRISLISDPVKSLPKCWNIDTIYGMQGPVSAEFDDIPCIFPESREKLTENGSLKTGSSARPFSA
jgi:hypothetical protein